MPRLSLSVAALGLCVVPLVAACTADARPSAARPSAAKAAGSPGVGVKAAAASASGPSRAQLRAALPPRPAGSKPWPASYGPEGVLTDRQYIAAAGPNTVAELNLQRERGLQFGANWSWSEPSGVQVEILLARYATPAGAASYYASERSGQLQRYPGVTAYTLPGEPQSFGLPIATVQNDPGETVVRTNALAGDTVIVVNVNRPVTPDTAVANAVSRRIRQSLCADQACATS